MSNATSANHVAAKRSAAAGRCSARTSAVEATQVKGVWPEKLTAAKAGRLAGPLAIVKPSAPYTPFQVPWVVVSMRTNAAVAATGGGGTAPAAPKNRPLIADVSPAVRVTRSVTWPRRFQTRYLPALKAVSVRVSSTAP